MVGIASSVAPIAAVAVMLSSGHRPSQMGVSVSRVVSVAPMAAVAVMLSSGQRPLQIGVSVSAAVSTGSTVEPGVRVATSTTTAGPQETKRNRSRVAANNREILVNFVLMAPCLSNKSCSGLRSIPFRGRKPLRKTPGRQRVDLRLL